MGNYFPDSFGLLLIGMVKGDSVKDYLAMYCSICWVLFPHGIVFEILEGLICIVCIFFYQVSIKIRPEAHYHSHHPQGYPRRAVAQSFSQVK